MNEPNENLIADAVVDAVRKHLPYGAVDNVYWGAMWQEIRREARSHISAELAAFREEWVPEGYMLLPKEPTLDMYYAACKAYCAWEVQCAEEERAGNEFSQPNFTHSDVYRAMIAAAPKKPAAKRESVPETDFRR